MKILLSHLTGNAFVKAATYGLIEAGMLSDFHVGIASVPGSMIDRIGAIKLFSEIRRRRYDAVVKPFLHTWPWFEMGRLLAIKGGFSKLANQKGSPFNIDSVLQNIDKHVAKYLVNAEKKGLNAVYAYEDSSLHTFRKSKNLGLQCLYDLPIGYWRTLHRLLGEERERWPDWVNTMPGLNDPEEKLFNKDEELRLADRIFVASTFTAKTLADFPGILAPVEIIPYGFPPVYNKEREYSNLERKNRLKLLFVGGLSQRKGIADLFKAVESFDQRVDLTIVGRKAGEDCPALNKALARHRWIPTLSHQDVLQLMRQNDVLVFPSLFEGFGLVITEAMSQGTPVITTDRTAGPDVIENGKNGWLIQAASTEALKESIEGILIKPGLVKELGIAAIEKARLRPWEIYGREIAAAIQKHFHQ
ncbi:MAG: glycosyltransferase family 4 protein [Ginsengibacter sp.]